MRLLHTTTLEFEEFFDSNIPPYAILSHCWGSKEVTFKEMRKRTAPPGPGLAKIQKFCQMAVKMHGLEWAWIDTCCIDKRSSAELSEAINSMYKWYRRSEVCYAHLSDVELSPRDLPKPKRSQPGTDLIERFRNSRWFTRGWTLQELLAPKDVIFFNTEWDRLGDRDDLAHEIAAITRIQRKYLSRYKFTEPIWRASVARRMSWASLRVTSREEDMAYCLLGLFGVNMPLLYGEGAIKSFQRLQIEIMQSSEDESIFAWTSDEPSSGLLAARPSCFAGSGDILPASIWLKAESARPRYKVAYRGVELAISGNHPENGVITFALNCFPVSGEEVCIDLRFWKEVAVRIRCDTLRRDHRRALPGHDGSLAHELIKTRIVYVRQPTELEMEILGHRLF